MNNRIITDDLEEETVTAVIDGVEKKCDVLFSFDCEDTAKVYVCYTDHSLNAEGKENIYTYSFDPVIGTTSAAVELNEREIEMVNNFKSCDIVQLAEYLNLSAKKLSELKEMQHSMHKFEDLLTNKVVDSKKYKVVYNYFYTNQVPTFQPLV